LVGNIQRRGDDVSRFIPHAVGGLRKVLTNGNMSYFQLGEIVEGTNITRKTKQQSTVTRRMTNAVRINVSGVVIDSAGFVLPDAFLTGLNMHTIPAVIGGKGKYFSIPMVKAVLLIVLFVLSANAGAAEKVKEVLGATPAPQAADTTLVPQTGSAAITHKQASPPRQQQRYDA